MDAADLIVVDPETVYDVVIPTDVETLHRIVANFDLSKNVVIRKDTNIMLRALWDCPPVGNGRFTRVTFKGNRRSEPCR